MKFCPVVPKVCCGQVHVPRKERKEEEKKNNYNNNKKRSKTISLQTLFGRLNNNNKKRSKNNKSPNVIWET